MSDGITDSYRDQRRAEAYEEFLCRLADYIENPIEENLTVLKSAGEQTDGVPRGLVSGRTDISSGIEDLLKALFENDERIWGKLLLNAHGGYPEEGFRKLKRLSPFKDKIIVEVDYGIGFVSLSGEFQNLIDKVIGGAHNMKTYDGDSYMLAIPNDVLKDANVVWLKCGIGGVKGSRKAREK
ncbi:MAG: hypothetical protein Q8R34_00290 [bacterium]|nr:hypothetical protein [bacterium]